MIFFFFFNFDSINNDYNAIQQNYEQQIQQQQQLQQLQQIQQQQQRTTRTRQSRQSRNSIRNSRLDQQQIFQTAAQQQHMNAYQQQPSNYAMDVQTTPITTTPIPMQINLAEQTSQQVQAYLNQQHTFITANETQKQQSHPIQKQLKPNLLHKPYNKVTSQGYKFSPPSQTFDPQQCKFTGNSIKVIAIYIFQSFF